MTRFLRVKAALLSAALLCASSLAHSQTVFFDETHSLGQSVQPIEREFEIFTAGNYDVALTDLAVPAAAVSGTVRAAITRGNEVVKLVSAGTAASFAATPGPYAIRIIGTPDPSKGIASIGAKVSLTGAGTVAADFSDTLKSLDTVASTNPRILDASVDITAAGIYDVTLTDRVLPATLSTLTLAIVKQGGSALDLQLTAAGTGSFTATLGTYRIFAIGQSPTTSNAGAYSVTVKPRGSAASVFSQTLAVGRTQRLDAVTLPSGDHSLVVGDLANPAPLATLRTLLVRGGDSVATLTAGGSQAFAATAGTYEILVAAAASAGNAGSYAVRISRASTEVFSEAHAVADATSVNLPFEFSSGVATAGSYQMRVGDFQFPQALGGLRAILTQGGAVVSSLTTAGQVDAPLVAGQQATILVFSSAPAQASGIFGVALQPNFSGATLIEATKGVGGSFTSRKISITNSGAVDATLTDLSFPQAFTELAAVVTRGTTRVGSIFGGGTFNFDAATPGNYFVNFIAKPNATAGFGTYRILLAVRPPAPTVSLSVDTSTVTSGATARLTWSSTNATSCTATGPWSGGRATSGTELTPAITSSATFKLDCTGAGGSASAQVTVSAQASSGSGGGGGGAISPAFLLLLIGIHLYAVRRQMNFHV